MAEKFAGDLLEKKEIKDNRLEKMKTINESESDAASKQAKDFMTRKNDKLWDIDLKSKNYADLHDNGKLIHPRLENAIDSEESVMVINIDILIRFTHSVMSLPRSVIGFFIMNLVYETLDLPDQYVITVLDIVHSNFKVLGDTIRVTESFYAYGDSMNISIPASEFLKEFKYVLRHQLNRFEEGAIRKLTRVAEMGSDALKKLEDIIGISAMESLYEIHKFDESMITDKSMYTIPHMNVSFNKSDRGVAMIKNVIAYMPKDRKMIEFILTNEMFVQKKKKRFYHRLTKPKSMIKETKTSKKNP